jgi:hypothetical protein
MSYVTRKDNRTDEQFALDIALDTAKQRVWAEILQNYFQEKTNKVCEKIEYGVDNDGNVVHGNLENDNVDNIFVFGDNQRKIEIKTIPEFVENFMTFKASSLRSCFRQNAYIVVPKRFVFYTYSTSICEELHRKYPHKIYDRFSPNDPAVRIYKSDIEKFMVKKEIMVKEWTQSCKELIEDNWELLSKEKERKKR